MRELWSFEAYRNRLGKVNAEHQSDLEREQEKLEAENVTLRAELAQPIRAGRRRHA